REAADVSDAAWRRTVPIGIMPADGDAGDAAGGQAGVGRRDVDIERGVVFRDAGPDLPNRGQLTRRKRRGIAVLIEGGRDDVRERAPARLHVAVEVEIELLGRRRVAGKR